MYRIVMGFLVWMAAVLPASAQDELGKQQAALKVIREAAADICYTVQQYGQLNETQWSGEVQGKVSGATGKIISLGVAGSGKLEDSKYQGVLPEQISQTLIHSMDCKKGVFGQLIHLMIPTAQRAENIVRRRFIPTQDANPPTPPTCKPFLVPGAVALYFGNNVAVSLAISSLLTRCCVFTIKTFFLSTEIPMDTFPSTRQYSVTMELTSLILKITYSQ
jgi:hypothetical protein